MHDYFYFAVYTRANLVSYVIDINFTSLGTNIVDVLHSDLWALLSPLRQCTFLCREQHGDFSFVAGDYKDSYFYCHWVLDSAIYGPRGCLIYSGTQRGSVKAQTLIII